MTRRSTFKVLPTFDDPKSELHKKKDKKKGELSSGFKSDEVSTFERTPDKKGTCYEPEIESNSEEDDKSKPDNTMVDITTMTMDKYNRRM